MTTTIKSVGKEGQPTQEGFKDIYVLLIGLAIAALFLVIGFLSYSGVIGFEFRAGENGTVANPEPLNILLDWMVLAALAILGPYGFVRAKKLSHINGIEKRLPDFLRDVAEAGRFGMTLPEAIIVASKGRYGPLTEEIKRMASQLEWGVPVREALHLFEQRINTPLTKRVVAIIIKANEAGGNVADVLTMVSHDAKEAQLAEEQRRISMSTYLAVIYISFGVFLVTIYIMAATFLPEMITAGTQIGSATQAAGGASGAVAISIQFIPVIFLAFFVAVIVHAIGDGIMAGVIDSGKLEVGMMHATFMLVAGWIFMRFLVPVLNV
ncbi:MAG: type II secretion system F family protein [Candidatus Thermoplasmatota archaeon]|jgi:flagellar protein FlaJ|nr:type II secretion system F family protein [Candidatus Thermoplasmatota archaeon]MCL5984383.1 type II secretion system F family protein [Candidatus Thermoplasmatota archaeon]